MKSILVTGANGLLGARCIAALAKDPAVNVLAVFHRGTERLLANPPPNISYIHCDLVDTRAVRLLFKSRPIDSIVHTAALLQDLYKDCHEKMILANVAATANLSTVALESGCARFIYTSSVSVYGTTREQETPFFEDDIPTPEDLYAWSKLAGEQYLQMCCKNNEMHGLSLRLSGLHGPGRAGGVFYHFARNAIGGKPIKVRALDAPFQFLHLDDAVSVILQALYLPTEKMSGYLAINTASTVASSLREIAERILRVAGSNVPIISDGDTVPLRHQVMDTSRLRQSADFHPCGVDETVASVIEWLRKESAK